jgi:hypothetical protein
LSFWDRVWAGLEFVILLISVSQISGITVMYHHTHLSVSLESGNLSPFSRVSWILYVLHISL